MFELVELIGERLDLLHLVVDHLDELCDFLRRVDDRLNGVRWVVNDPLRACRHGDAECHERECDEFLHGDTPPNTRKDLPRREEAAVYHLHNVRGSTAIRCRNEVKQANGLNRMGARRRG
jgi:hypothetical protein